MFELNEWLHLNIRKLEKLAVAITQRAGWNAAMFSNCSAAGYLSKLKWRSRVSRMLPTSFVLICHCLWKQHSKIYYLTEQGIHQKRLRKWKKISIRSWWSKRKVLTFFACSLHKGMKWITLVTISGSTQENKKPQADNLWLHHLFMLQLGTLKTLNKVLETFRSQKNHTFSQTIFYATINITILSFAVVWHVKTTSHTHK